MTEAEIKKAINTNQAKYGTANDATKALLLAKNEGLAKQLDTLTGGKSTFDAASGRWALSGDNRNPVDRYLQQKELVEYIAKSLVDSPELVEVREAEGEQGAVLELSVSHDDLGKIIGKQGRTARAIRTLLGAVSAKTKKRVVLEILE